MFIFFFIHNVEDSFHDWPPYDVCVCKELGGIFSCKNFQCLCYIFQHLSEFPCNVLSLISVFENFR